MWFRVDDRIAFHPKAVEAGNAAMGLWLRAGAWSSGQLTDGFIPSPIASSMGSAREISSLASVGLWVPVDGGGWVYHDWLDFNPSREQVEQRRRADAERLAKWRAENSTRSRHV